MKVKYLFQIGEKNKEKKDKKINQLHLFGNNKKYETTPIALDVIPFFEDVMLTLYDFNFLVWKHNVTFPIFESLIMKQAHITRGGFSPYRAGIIIIGKTDGNLDVWDMLDQSHKWNLQFQVVTCAITLLKQMIIWLILLLLVILIVPYIYLNFHKVCVKIKEMKLKL